MIDRYRRGLRLGLAAALLVVVAAGCFGDPSENGSSPTRSDGPLRDDGEHGTLLRGLVGVRVSDGLELLLLDGDQPATILSVRSFGAEGHLRFLGAVIAGPDRHLGGHDQLIGFPPNPRRLGTLETAEGAEILPRDQTRGRVGYEMFVGYEVLRDTDVAVRTHLEVAYRVDATDYVATFRSQLVYCPESMSSDDCFDHADTQVDSS